MKIIGEKVVLAKATEQMLKELYYWKYEEQEQEAKKWNGPYITEPYLSFEEFKANWQRNTYLYPQTPKALAILAGDKVIGTVSSYWVDKQTNWLETGIVIYDPSFWNDGYGTEAYRLWINFLFESTPLHRLGMSTWSGNVRMIKAAAKLGMKEEARVREARIVDGEYYDAVKMGILRSEWEALKEVTNGHSLHNV